jgi:hypothetical protein
MDNFKKYLVFANQAEIQAETSTNPVLRKHFLRMGAQWRRFADYTEPADVRRV